MFISVSDMATTEDAICDLGTAISLFKLLIPSYFEETEEPPSYSSDREHIGNLLRATEDYVRSAKEILEAELERSIADREEHSPHTTE